MNVSFEKAKISTVDWLTPPDLVKKLVQIILLNREKDKKVIEKIKNILLEWEE